MDNKKIISLNKGCLTDGHEKAANKYSHKRKRTEQPFIDPRKSNFCGILQDESQHLLTLDCCKKEIDADVYCKDLAIHCAQPKYTCPYCRQKTNNPFQETFDEQYDVANQAESITWIMKICPQFLEVLKKEEQETFVSSDKFNQRVALILNYPELKKHYNKHLKKYHNNHFVAITFLANNLFTDYNYEFRFSKMYARVYKNIVLQIPKIRPNSSDEWLALVAYNVTHKIKIELKPFIEDYRKQYRDAIIAQLHQAFFTKT